MRTPLLAAALALAATRAEAQRMSADAQVWMVEHRLLYQGSELTQTGTWLGVRAALAHRALRFEIGSHAGSLGGSPDPAHPDRDVRTTLIEVRMAVRPWLEVGAAGEARRSVSAAGASTWRTYGLTARLAGDLGMPALRGFATLSLFPASSGTAVIAPTSASRGMIGLQVAPRRGRVFGELSYRFERYNVDDPSSAPRHEQFEVIALGIGVLLAR